MASDAKSYAESQGLPAALTAAMKTVLLEKPADGKARLVELLSEGGTGYYVHNNKGNENGAKGGKLFEASKAAIVFIEYQNEFTTEGGKLNGGVKGIMETTGMLSKSADVAEACRKAGVKVMHAAITFAEDASDNPNKALGILAGCAKDKLFTAGTWNAEFCKEMTPKEGDLLVTGKKGLDAFPGTDLEAQLKANGIETVVLAGFLTNCCVESTMRSAYEKGFDVITLTDCCATLSEEGQKVTEGSFGFFSTPMTAADFKGKLA
eukprot:CAMPEP_0181242432 /NCGR_PEP_ID=MMETSP1096-20121128/41682_1 /TAXON_ID=156174 ORGANISM="Chrysochromulina ericina, Strain CCMP281" /NCGR_SAMPLE_ID=MMETSP1096 /ASSEMBLY_ACC=CAM_ASM_000453 /LENGTH=263 /DNA_ID=CAMNT_0023338631 /DNA_START=26 /DNA_END=817 /DNA_ORIENTATION=-